MYNLYSSHRKNLNSIKTFSNTKVGLPKHHIRTTPLVAGQGVLVLCPTVTVDQALSEARATLEQIREEVQAWQTQHNAVHKKLKAEKAANSTLKVYATKI